MAGLFLCPQGCYNCHIDGKGIVIVRFTLFLCVFVLLFCSPILAQESKIEHDFSQRELDSWKNQVARYTGEYDKIVKEIYKDFSKIDAKVRVLRSYYPRTEQYTPFSKRILDKMTRYASAIEDETDREVINKNLLSYRDLVSKHLMNFEILSFALTMSRIDVRFGSDVFFEKVRQALIDSFYVEGMGKTPESAYYIVSYGEETYILEKIGGVIKNSELYKVHRKYYNVHDILGKNGEYQQIFMDVTVPIRNVLYKQVIREKQNKISLKPF